MPNLAGQNLEDQGLYRVTGDATAGQQNGPRWEYETRNVKCEKSRSAHKEEMQQQLSGPPGGNRTPMIALEERGPIR